MKSRLELIVEELIRTGGIQDGKAVWSLARAESAKIEAEMVSLSNESQNDIIGAINKIKLKQLEAFSTDSLKDEIRSSLGNLIDKYTDLARQLAISNIISGKFSSGSSLGYSSNNPIDRLLTNEDYALIDKSVSDVVSRIKYGASLAFSSVSSMLQRASIAANQKKKPTVNEPWQVPDSNTSSPQEALSFFSQNTEAEDIHLSEADLAEIKRNPAAFISKNIQSNTKTVLNLRKKHIEMMSEHKSELQSISKHGGAKENDNASIKKALKTEFLTNGLSAFTDVAGRKWALSTYCIMSTRTFAARTTNLGEVFADKGHDLYYIVPHGGSCPICSKYEGKVYSRSGMSRKYPPLSSVFKKIDPNGPDDLSNSYLSIHPNCRHKLIRYFEKSTKKS